MNQVNLNQNNIILYIVYYFYLYFYWLLLLSLKIIHIFRSSMSQHHRFRMSKPDVEASCRCRGSGFRSPVSYALCYIIYTLGCRSCMSVLSHGRFRRFDESSWHFQRLKIRKFVQCPRIVCFHQIHHYPWRGVFLALKI